MAIQRNLLDQNTSDSEKESVLETHSSGQLYKNEKPSDARLYDLVRGEETSNAHLLDLSRLQNLFFTLILVGGYAAGLGSYLVSQIASSAHPLRTFPEISSSFVALLAISHARYLPSKAIDKQ